MKDRTARNLAAAALPIAVIALMYAYLSFFCIAQMKQEIQAIRDGVVFSPGNDHNGTTDAP